MPFHTEIMRCSLCQVTQKADLQIESGWYALEADGLLIYGCPRCVGNTAAPRCKQCTRYYHEQYASCPWCKPQEA